jgi:hypothetical protein
MQMNMPSSSVNPLAYYSAYYPQKNATNAQTAFKNLGTALQSGDLSGAQVAFATLQQASQGQNQGGMNRAISADMSNLGNALSANNLSSAQASYVQLHTDVEAQRMPRYQSASGTSGGIGGVIQSLIAQLSPTSSTLPSTSATPTGLVSPTISPGTLNVQA